MPKWVKMFVGLLLLPVCLATAKAVWLVLSHAGASDRIWLPMLAGAAGWLAIFLFLPKPTWVYVVGHEMTHAVWTWLFGGKVKRFKASSDGGHVIVTKNNFLIVLAPYFFPFYAVLLVGVFWVGDFIWHWQPYATVFHLLLGAAYAFHLTLTVEILKTRQSDITSQGYIFSAAAIFLGNALVLLFGVPLLTKQVTLYNALTWWLDCNHQMLHRVVALF